MKKRIVAITIVAIFLVASLSARSLDLFKLPFVDKEILWTEVGRDDFELDRNEFELEGPEERWFEISLEGKAKSHHFGSDSKFLKREMNSILKDEREDSREEGYNFETLIAVSDDSHYHLRLEISDRFGVYYKSYMGLLLDSGAYFEFESEYLKDDAFTIEKIEESLLNLQ